MLHFFWYHPPIRYCQVHGEQEPTSHDSQTLSEYDKYSKSKDTAIQQDLIKDTDILEWWPVCHLICTTHFLLIGNSIRQFRTFSNPCMHSNSLSGIFCLLLLWTAVLRQNWWLLTGREDYWASISILYYKFCFFWLTILNLRLVTTGLPTSHNQL